MVNEREFLLMLIRASVVGNTGCVIPESINWTALIEEAHRQNISVIASDGLQKLYDAGIYTNLGNRELRRTKAQWFVKTLKHEQRYENQMAVAKRMVEWFAPVGLQTIVLKGFTVSECYPIPSHRYCADLDCFLIKDGEHLMAYEEGNREMEKRGLTVNRSFYKNSSFSIDETHVENHKYCIPFRGNQTLRRFEWLLQKMILAGPLVPIADTGLLAPPPLASTLFLVEHAYSHFLHEGLNLRHFLDLFLFRRRHLSDIDWTLFDKYVDEFGLRRFYVAFYHVAQYILGEQEYDSLSAPERRMMESVWAGMELHDTVRGLRGKLSLVGNTLRARWKYREFSPISMPKALWIQVKGFLFERNPMI